MTRKKRLDELICRRKVGKFEVRRNVVKAAEMFRIDNSIISQA